MRFSVIIPVYNAEKTLNNTVSSVLRQTGENRFDVEMVLVENGSTDASHKICDDLAADYHFITALHREKIGAYAARRLGMEAASGDYLLFVDADDELSDGALESLYGFIKAHGGSDAPDIIFYDYERVSPQGSTIRTFPFEEGRVYRGEDRKAFYDVMCSGDLLNPLWNKCVKRALAVRSLEEDMTIFLNHGEDLLQTAQLIDKADSITCLHKVIYRYNSDGAGLTGSYHKEFLPNQVTSWNMFDQIAAKWGGEGNYKELLEQRKALTCCIAVKSLLFSDLKKRDVLEALREILSDPFYAKYHEKALPGWAPEEDGFIHGLLMGSDAEKKLMGFWNRRRIKEFIKERIRK